MYVSDASYASPPVYVDRSSSSSWAAACARQIPVPPPTGMSPVPHTGKRTRRGGRGRTRRRGRRGRDAASSALYPWWYAHMVKMGWTPTGLTPDSTMGYPVILPTLQRVYLLPSAKNAHKAATYAPFPQASGQDNIENENDTAAKAHIPSCLFDDVGSDVASEDDTSDDAHSLSSEASAGSSGSRRWASAGGAWQPAEQHDGWRTPFDEKHSLLDLSTALSHLACGKGDKAVVIQEEEFAVVSDNEDDNLDRPRKNYIDNGDNERPPTHVCRVTIED